MGAHYWCNGCESITWSHIGDTEGKHLIHRGHHCDGCAKGAGTATGGAGPVRGQPGKGLAAPTVRPYDRTAACMLESSLAALGKVLQSSGLQPCCSQLQIRVAQSARILCSRDAHDIVQA